ncbi:uncharacterized protein BDV14DRAFT_206971 [Aspergillus stella-maris]|uniref:uncharacterized protein n=1 Tax=Aspergillus stella-maris TaxID=1810926 RepID=UPI003CCCCDEF
MLLAAALGVSLQESAPIGTVEQRARAVVNQVTEQQSWLEKTLKPKTISARYWFKGKMLLYTTGFFGGLGDALFGYNSSIMSGLLVNPVFISRFFKDYGGADGSTAAVDPSITGISVACLQAAAAGIAVGFLSMTVPIIQTEIAAPHHRGLMVGIKYTMSIAGYMLSCWVDYGFNFLLPEKMSWQGPFIVQVGLAFILLLTVADLHANGDTTVEHVQHTNLGKSTWTEMFTRYRKRTIVGITVQMFAQLNGINIISFYLPSTLASAGFDNRKSLLYTTANAIPYTAATVVTWWLANSWGRKPLLILGGFGMAILLGIVCAIIEANIDIAIKANAQYAFVMLYNICYGFTWGPMPWLLPAKIFPLQGRSKGMALATTSNWIFNFIIGMVSPDAFAGIGGYFYLVIAGFCLFSAGLVYFYYVETANHSLEEIAALFGNQAFADEGHVPEIGEVRKDGVKEVA